MDSNQNIAVLLVYEKQTHRITEENVVVQFGFIMKGLLLRQSALLYSICLVVCSCISSQDFLFFLSVSYVLSTCQQASQWIKVRLSKTITQCIVSVSQWDARSWTKLPNSGWLHIHSDIWTFCLPADRQLPAFSQSPSMMHGSGLVHHGTWCQVRDSFKLWQSQS